MRCFISVDLSDEVKDYLFNLQKEFSSIVKVKWVAKKNLHLTLRFLGEIDDEQLKAVKKRLLDIRFNRFKVLLDGVGVFPDEIFIRVIWIGLISDELIELQKRVDESILDLFPTDQRFLSHLTLGRVKCVKDKEGLRRILNNIKVKKFEFEVDSFKLYKSELNRDGPKYFLLEGFELE